MARVSELLETDNHIIRPYFRFANHAKFFETRFLFIETLFAMFDLWKLYSNSYTASLNEVLITTCLIEPAMLSCFTVTTNIDYSFPLSLLLQQETLLAVPRCTNPGYEALPKKESNRERRSVTMVRSCRIFRTKCRYITNATENFVTRRE